MVKTKFLIHWELNPDKELKNLAEVTKGLPNVKGVKVLESYATPTTPVWGVTLVEADSEEALFSYFFGFVLKVPGMFSKYFILPSLPTEKAIEKLLKQ